MRPILIILLLLTGCGREASFSYSPLLQLTCEIKDTCERDENGNAIHNMCRPYTARRSDGSCTTTLEDYFYKDPNCDPKNPDKDCVSGFGHHYKCCEVVKGDDL